MALNSAEFKHEVGPFLNVVFDGRYATRSPEYTKAFKVEQGIQRSVHEEPVLVPFGLASEKPQGAPITYDDTSAEAGVARYVYVTYGLAWSITEELVEDGDHISIGKIYSANLADSMMYTKELIHQNVLNRAFNSSYVGYDAVSLCNTSHQLGLAAVQSNTLASPIALSQAGLEQLLVNISVAKDGRGKIIKLQPDEIVIPPQLVYVAERLTKSVLQSGTSANDINAVRSINGINWSKFSLLTSPTAWFITTNSPRGLMSMERRKITTQMMGDFETGNMRHRATMRFQPGWTDPLGIFGTQGA